MAPLANGGMGRLPASTTSSGVSSMGARSNGNTMAAPPSRAGPRTAAASSSQPLRATASSSSLRAKAAANARANGNNAPTPAVPVQASARTADPSTSQAASAPPLQASSLPLPTFPSAASTASAEVTTAQVHARLLQLAHRYVATSSHQGVLEVVSGDLDSACFYARLALNCDPSSVPARRLLAVTLLQGAQALPFGPSSTHTSVALSSSLASITSATRAGAHAAIELLQDGSAEVFLDVGCARIFAAACTVLGKLTEAEEALTWTMGELERRMVSGSKVAAGQSSAVPASTSEENVRQAFILSELGRLSSRTARYEEARMHLSKARKLDTWSWSAWVTLCDVEGTDDVATSFPTAQHDPRTFYVAHLKHSLMAHDYDEALVQRTMDDIITQGRAYYDAPVSIPVEESGPAGPVDRSAPATGALANRLQAPSAPMVRTTSNNKRTVAQAITPSTTPTSFTRPGSRAAVAKRMKTVPAASKPAGGAGARAGGLSSSARPASTAASKSKPTSATTTTATAPGSVRMTGTLSASRTNEQARPASSASTSSRSTAQTNDDLLKGSPRRSARVNLGTAENQPQGQQARQAAAAAAAAQPPMPPLPSQARTVQQPALTTVRRAVVTRPGVRPAQATTTQTTSSSSSSSSDADSAPKTLAGRVPPPVNKALTAIVQTAAQHAVHEAVTCDAVEAVVLELVRTLAKAYQAVRNSRGRLALALLRPRGPLSQREAAEVRREAILAATPTMTPATGQQVPLPPQPAIQVYGGVSAWHRNCAEVQCLIARALHDVGRYAASERHFAHARRLSPTLMQHMDIYSLTLFHLQREVELAGLAKELGATDSSSCIAHIAKGNSFALQREHGQALRCFERACAAGPDYAYAFTLAGYEACELGAREESVRFFREAIKIEGRHWNAYAGLGQMYLQDGKLQQAAYYYGNALELHRNNALLWDVYGRVRMAQGALGVAERAFGCALRLDATSAMSHVKLAEVLLRRAAIVSGSLDAEMLRKQAHTHLLSAVKLAPDEAHVHLMLAKSYMDMGAGTFATLLHSSGSAPQRTHIVEGEEEHNAGDGPEEVSLGDLAHVGLSGPGHLLTQQQQQIRAVGHATIPARHRAEIARHLCTAVDLNPRLARYVKAMGEGARAALRGAAARLTGDLSAGGSVGVHGDGSASLLVDGVTGAEEEEEEEEESSMVELDSEQVLEDGASETDVEEGVEGDEDGSMRDGDGLQDDERGDNIVPRFVEDSQFASGFLSLDVLREGGGEVVDLDSAMSVEEQDNNDNGAQSYEQPVRLRHRPGRARLGVGMNMSSPQRHHAAAQANASDPSSEDERDVSMSF